MGPEFGFGMGEERGADKLQRPRPSLLVRGLELAGLALVTYGLGSYRFALAALGAGIIVGSYALYRRKHGPMSHHDPNHGGDGADMGGDGD